MTDLEAAVQAVTDKRLLDGFCRHDRRCLCRNKLRLSAWATLDALTRSGWTIQAKTEAGEQRRCDRHGTVLSGGDCCAECFEAGEQRG